MKHCMLSRLKRISSAGLFVILVLSCFGCGADNRTGDRPKTTPVTGVITYNGEPVLDGLITFHPKGPGNPALGKVDENGKFILTTYEKGDGAVLGQHVVTVQVMPEGAVPGMEAKTGGGMSIPKKYNSPDTSPLIVRIEDEGNELQLVLE